MKRWRVDTNVDGDRVALTLGHQRVLIVPAREARRWARQTRQVLPRVKTVTWRLDADLTLTYSRAAAVIVADRILGLLDAILAGRRPDPPPTGRKGPATPGEADSEGELPPDPEDAHQEARGPAREESQAVPA